MIILTGMKLVPLKNIHFIGGASCASDYAERMRERRKVERC